MRVDEKPQVQYMYNAMILRDSLPLWFKSSFVKSEFSSFKFEFPFSESTLMRASIEIVNEFAEKKTHIATSQRSC